MLLLSCIQCFHLEFQNETEQSVLHLGDLTIPDQAADDSKFGQKLMERMGWSKGEGLGANRDGNPESVAVAVKNDNKGVGWNKNSEDNWIAHQDDFNSLLSSLNQNHGSGDGNGDKVLSLEQTSRSAKGRVHYQKFTKGKDLSLKTEKDLDCVFGKRKSRPKEEKAPDTQEDYEPSAEEKEDSSGLNTVTSTDSIQDYFAKKMATLKNKRNQPNANNNVEMSEYDEKDFDNVNTETNVDDIDVEKGKKRKYQDFAYSYDDNNSLDNTDNVDNNDNKDGKVKKKRKSVRFSIGDDDAIEPNCDIEHSADVESENKKKKKKSKKKKKENEEIDKDVDTNLNDSSALNESVNDTAVDSDTEKVLDNDNELGEVSVDSVNIEKKSAKKKKSKKAKKDKEIEKESTDFPVGDSVVDVKVENGSDCIKVLDNDNESEQINVGTKNTENKSSKKKKSKKGSKKEKEIKQEAQEAHTPDMKSDKERNKRNKKRKLMEEGYSSNETEKGGSIEVNKETAEEMDCGISDSPTLKKEKKKKRKKAEMEDSEIPEKKMKIESTEESQVIEDAELVNPFPNRNAENILLKYATDNNLEIKFIMATSGPGHKPVHTMHAEIGDRKFNAVQCKQKKEAQKKAAIAALCVLNKEGAFDVMKEQETKKEEEKKKSKSEKKKMKVKEEADSTGKTKKKKGKDKGKKDKQDGHASKFFPGSCLDDVEGYAGLAFLPVASIEKKQKMKIKKKRSSGYFQKKK